MQTDIFSLNKNEVIHIFQAFARMVERDEWDNSFHLERIQRYCFILANGLDLPSSEVETISIASILHDVGKMEIATDIFTKTDPLKPHEWELIEQHPIFGRKVLRGSTSHLMQTAEVIAFTHHERWDGSGYPQGLRGEDIPIGGRICAIADVFDALTTPRPYKVVISSKAALDLIKEASGTLFDPALVNLFESQFQNVSMVMEKYRG
jgi:putative two-component system response regulator